MPRWEDEMGIRRFLSTSGLKGAIKRGRERQKDLNTEISKAERAEAKAEKATRKLELEERKIERKVRLANAKSKLARAKTKKREADAASFKATRKKLGAAINVVRVSLPKTPRKKATRRKTTRKKK